MSEFKYRYFVSYYYKNKGFSSLHPIEGWGRSIITRTVKIKHTPDIISIEDDMCRANNFDAVLVTNYVRMPNLPYLSRVWKRIIYYVGSVLLYCAYVNLGHWTWHNVWFYVSPFMIAYVVNKLIY